MSNLISVNDDNRTVAGYILEGTIDTVIFDPPFESLYNGYDYTSFLRNRIDAAISTMTYDGKFVSINYSNAQTTIKEQLKEHGMTADWTCRIRRNDRGCRTLVDGPDIIIRCFSRNDSNDLSLSFGDAHHKAGNNKVSEGMPMREIEGILHSLNINDSNIVLDMFGGSGAVALAANSYGAQCITIENIFKRYNDINDRLHNFISTPNLAQLCSIKTCNREKTSNNLCKNHNRMLAYYGSRPMFIGENKEGHAVLTGGLTPLREQLSLAGFFADQAILRSNLIERKEKVEEFVQRLGYSSSSFQTYNDINCTTY